MARESKRKRDEKRIGRPERLADMVGAMGWSVPPYCSPLLDDPISRRELAEMHRDLVEKVHSGPVVVADNVCEFLYAENPKEEWVYERDFPSCVPPFASFFVEVGRPSRILSEGKVVSSSVLPDRWGWHFDCQTRDEMLSQLRDRDYRDSLIRNLKSHIEQLMPLVDMGAIERAAKAPDPNAAYDALGFEERSIIRIFRQVQEMEAGEDGSSKLGDTHWGVHATSVAFTHGRLVSFGTAAFGVSARGSLDTPIFYVMGGQHLDKPVRDQVNSTLSSQLFPALLAISFMNCKNVALEQHDPDKAVGRERRKAGLKPFVRYHTINIEPMKAVLRKQGNSETSGLKKALHICRGHFSTYSEERPLFGRHAGTFWVPSHVRGSAKQGIVVSDYNVKPS